MKKYQMFAAPDYCDFSSASSAIAGKSLLVGIYANDEQTDLLAIAGQSGLTVNRSAEAIEINSKTNDGWKDSLPGMKEWSIELEGLWVKDDASHKALSEAFANDSAVCVVVYKNSDPVEPLFGGMASITDYPLEAPNDDAVTFSTTLQGKGPLTDLTNEDPEAEKKITGFIVAGVSATIDNAAHTVQAELPSGTDLTELTPTITVSTGATISPASGVEQDFTSPVEYTVTASDATTQVYTVTLTVEV